MLMLLLLLLGWVGQMDGRSHQPNCLPGYATEDEMAFSQPSKNSYRIYVSSSMTYVELICCIKGYRSMKWYKKNNGKWREIEQHGFMYYQQNDLNQTLTILKAEKKYRGFYMCVAEDSKNNSINSIIKLDITEHTEREVIVPTEQTVTRPLGSSVHIHCKASIGLDHEKSHSDICWRKAHYNSKGRSVQDSSVPKDGLLILSDANISITYESKAAYKSSTIIINNITNRVCENYTCITMNIFKSVGSSTKREAVKRTGLILTRMSDTEQRALIVVSIFMAAMLIVRLLVYCLMLDIKLFLRDRFAKAVDDGKECDAFIVYNSNDDNDRKFVTIHMINVLEKQHGYKLFLEDRDFPVGAPISENFMLGVQKSRSLVFLMSPALLNEAWVHFLYRSTAHRTDIPRIFLIYHQVDDSDWQCHQEDFKTAFKVAKRKVKWIVDQSQSSWLSYSTMSKQEIKFWKRLRLHLPKPLSLIRMQ